MRYLFALLLIVAISSVASASTKGSGCNGPVTTRHEAWNKQVIIHVGCVGDYPQVHTYYSAPGPGECEIRFNAFDRFGDFVVSIDWPVGVITPTIDIHAPTH